MLAVVAGSAGGITSGLIAADELRLAPDLELTAADGNHYRLSELRGKVVVVNFWATWCPPCRQEMPSMQRVWERLDQNTFEILAVNVGQSADVVLQYGHEFDPPLRFPLLLAPEGKVLKEWSVIGLPSTFVIDKAGRIAYMAAGEIDLDAPEIVNQLRALIARE